MQTSSSATNVFVCDIFRQMPIFPIMISTTHLLAKITLNLEVLHLKFIKPVSQKVVSKPRSTKLLPALKIYKAVFVQRLSNSLRK